MTLLASMHIPDTGNDSTASKHTLFVEVELRDQSRFLHREVKAQLSGWLRKNFAQLRVGQDLDLSQGTGTLKCSPSISRLQIVGHSELRAFPNDTYYTLADNDLCFYLYTLQTGDGNVQPGGDRGDHAHAQFSVKPLPHATLEGLWERLVFEEPIAENALYAITRSLSLRKDVRLGRIFPSLLSNVLFYGPPGTGKTTLSFALAQKLSIRSNDLYETAQLIEIHSHALLSRFFGESGKQVGGLFASICDLASDETALIIVTFDEIESLVNSREKSTEKNEVGDAVRSTNEVLRGLDRLAEFSNIVFIATSNLISNMDPAFLDRFHYQKLVRCPGIRCSYEILRSRVNSLITDGFVSVHVPSSDEFDNRQQEEAIDIESPGDDAVPSTPEDQNALLPATPQASHIPSINTAGALCPLEMVAASTRLHKIASLGEKLSARSLEGAIKVAICEHTAGSSCSLWDLLSALEKVVAALTSTTPDSQPPALNLSSQWGNETDRKIGAEIEDLDDEEEYRRAMAESGDSVMLS